MKLQKIMLDAGFTCPNRDGGVGYGGCTFCRTASFNPSYCTGTITEQLQKGKQFFAGKYPDMKFLAYFQAYSNTYAPLQVLRQRYEEALADPDVVGLVIATRPDCLADEVLQYLQSLKQKGYSITIELGIESLYDKTLVRINRGHTAQQSREAILRCSEAGFSPTIHLMLGLPGESRDEILAQAPMLNLLPIAALKLHQLQILHGTRMADEWQQHPEDFLNPTLPDYITLVRQFITQLRPDIRIERYASSAPPGLLIAPRWGLKPSEIERLITTP